MKSLFCLFAAGSLISAQAAPDPKSKSGETKAEAPKTEVAKPMEPKAELTSAQQDAQKIHAEASKLLEKGDILKAKVGFEKVLVLSPNNVPALVNIGLIEQRLRNFPEAERRFKQAIHEQGDNGLTWLLLGIASYEQGKLEAATAHLSEAVLYAPTNARAHNYLGATISQRGWYSGAEEQLRRAIELDPKYAEAHYNLAVLYLERVPPAVELARRHYEKSVQLGGARDEVIAKKLEE